MDIVITWVDGNDPKHSSKLQKHLQIENPHADSAEPTRYKESGEIYFCLASLIKFAPFVNRIFIVTDQQVPARLEEFKKRWNVSEDFIRIVDHSEIFKGYEEYLPTFNSITIETMLHRIPDLGEEFVYFNDDVMLIKPAVRELFFNDDGPIFRGNFKKYYKNRIVVALRMKIRSWLGRDPKKPGFRTSQQISGLMVGGFEKYLQIGHNPHPFRRSTLADYLDVRPETLRAQLQHRFRNYQQFSIPSLANHLEIKLNDIKPEKPVHALYINANGKTVDDVTQAFSKSLERGAHWACIQSLDEADPQVFDYIVENLRKIVPDFPIDDESPTKS